jgi:hypothetical protein
MRAHIPFDGGSTNLENPTRHNPQGVLKVRLPIGLEPDLRDELTPELAFHHLPNTTPRRIGFSKCRGVELEAEDIPTGLGLFHDAASHLSNHIPSPITQGSPGIQGVMARKRILSEPSWNVTEQIGCRHP